MLEECIRVVQPLSLRDWGLPGKTFRDLDNPDCVGRYLQADEPSNLRLRAPILLDRPSERSLFFPRDGSKEWYDFTLAPVRLDTVPQAQVVGDKFVVVSHDLKVFSESYWAEQNLNDEVHFHQQPSTIVSTAQVRSRPTTLFHDRPPTRRIDGPAMLLGNPWSFNYHHWLINCLSRLWWTDCYAELKEVPVIVPNRLTGFQQQSLAAMGVDANRILSFDGGPWLVERLFFPANGDFWPTQLRWIRRCLFSHYEIVEAPGTRLLYISRADATGRRVVNERQVADYLAGRGFEILQLGAMPLSEQIRAFSQARLVVGPHGSGLTNILFGPANLGLVELHPNDEVNHVFWVLSNAMQQSYAFLSGTRIHSDRDFEIDVADLDAVIEKLL